MKLDRRTCERFPVPGGAVDWESETDPGRVATDCAIGDLSRGGVRFQTTGPPRAGTPVRVTLRIPAEDEPLALRGNVAWCRISSGQIHQVTVAFSPYGPTPGDNLPAALERLVAIEARFLPNPP